MKSGRIVSELDSEKSKKVAFHALCSISCPIEKTLTNRKTQQKNEHRKHREKVKKGLKIFLCF